MITTKCLKIDNASQKRLAKFALIKYRINFRNYGILHEVIQKNN